MQTYENNLTKKDGILLLFTKLETMLYQKHDSIDSMLFLLDFEAAVNKAGYDLDELLDLLNMQNLDDIARYQLKKMAEKIAAVFEYWQYHDESERY